MRDATLHRRRCGDVGVVYIAIVTRRTLCVSVSGDTLPTAFLPKRTVMLWPCFDIYKHITWAVTVQTPGSSGLKALADVVHKLSKLPSSLDTVAVVASLIPACWLT